jgi:hypothetical protein
MKMIVAMRVKSCSYIFIVFISCTCTIRMLHDLEYKGSPGGLHMDSR